VPEENEVDEYEAGKAHIKSNIGTTYAMIKGYRYEKCTE